MTKIKMNKKNDIVMTVFGGALSAPLFLLAIAGCQFDPVEPGEGPPPRTSAVFCDFEKRERSCATESDLGNGVNLAEPDVDGFWNDKQMFGLDFSDAAKGACGGQPQKVLFAGPFPDGLNECVNPTFVGGTHPTLDAACSALCEEKGYNEMGYDCTTARASHRAANPFVNACTTEGTLMPAFVDPRRLPKLVNLIWTDAVSVQVIDNTVRKTSATPDYDAGAASKMLPMGKDGAFEFTAIEQDKERTAGFAKGPLPDFNASDADILYGVVLRAGGILDIVEQGLVVFSTAYPPDSRIRMVVADGKVHYYLRGVHLYSGAKTVTTELHVSVSLRDPGATIANAGITY
jgi:hypothetical protein